MIEVSLKQLNILLSKHYRFGRPVSARYLTKGFVNTSYEVLFDTSKGIRKYFFRLYRSGSRASEIQLEHNLLTELNKRGFGLAPTVVPAECGAGFLKIPAPTHEGEGPRHMALFTHLAGVDDYAWDNPGCNRPEFVSSARVLALYHATISGWLEGHNPPKQTILRALPRLAAGWKETSSGTPGKHLGRLNQEKLAGMAEQAQALSRRLGTEFQTGLPALVIHGDYHPGNLKYDREGVVGLFDFDWANLDLRAYDLALALNYFCSTWDHQGRDRLDLKKVMVFLAEYQSGFPWPEQDSQHGPLTRDELELLPDLLMAGNLYILDWILSDYLEGGISAGQYKRYLDHNLGLTDWLRARIGRLKILFSQFARTRPALPTRTRAVSGLRLCSPMREGRSRPHDAGEPSGEITSPVSPAEAGWSRLNALPKTGPAGKPQGSDAPSPGYDNPPQEADFRKPRSKSLPPGRSNRPQRYRPEKQPSED